jgi:hypothetical protein
VGSPPRSGASLLGLLEPGWRGHLCDGGLAGSLDVETSLLDAVARALGDQSRGRSPREVALRWPACVIVGLARVAGVSYRNGSFWPGWHRAAGLRATRRSADDWSQAFLEALTVLGIMPPGSGQEAVLVHAAVPDHCLPDFLRLLAADREAGGEAAVADLPGVDPAVAAVLRSPAAASFTERCRSALRLLMDPDLARDGGVSAGDQSLPRRVLEVAGVVAAEFGYGQAPASGPALRLDPFGQGLLVADGRDQAWRSALPDEVADLLLVFDEGGERAGPPLPAEPVWVVHPAGLDVRSDVPPQVVVTSRLPLTWQGWRLVQLDLRGVSWLEVDIPDETAARRYPVRGRLKPGLAARLPVPGVTTASGSSVHAGLPAVLLPAGPGRWRVEVRRAGGASVLAAVTTTAADWRPDRLWRQLSRPVLGTLTVTVTPADRSPGTSLRRTVTVAEGLGAAYSPAPRLTGDGGLERAEAVLAAPPGMTVSPQAAFVPAGFVAIDITCVAGPVILPLRATPPHLAMRIEPEPGSGGKPTMWHQLGPLIIGRDDLRRGGALRLDLPGLAWDPPIEVVARAQVVQVLEPTRQGRYPLRRMLDTLNDRGDVSLRITIGGRAATIAHVGGAAEGADPWLPADTPQSGR